MGYTEEPVTNTEFFGKKLGPGVFKQELLTEEQLAWPVSKVDQLIYWRWIWRGPGGFKVGKLIGSSSMKREYYSIQDIIEKFTKRADGRFFQTGYDEPPSEVIKKCKTVKELRDTFFPEEIKFKDENTQPITS